MALRFRLFALGSALGAAAMMSVPAAAQAPLPGIATQFSGFDQSRYDPSADTADWRRCRGWRCGYGHRGWRRNRVGAGDVLIGAAIIGGIAAIASANNRRERPRDVVIIDRDRNPDYRDPNPDFRDRNRRDDRRVERASTGSSGLDNAVDQCLNRIERDVRVQTVDSVDRTGAGWMVSGTLFNGAPFLCRIGNNGQIDGIDYVGGISSAPASGSYDRAGSQWDDQRYADARLAMGGFAQPQAEAPASAGLPQQPLSAPGPDRLPAYPGGPIPGEEIPETIDGDLAY